MQRVQTELIHFRASTRSKWLELLEFSICWALTFTGILTVLALDSGIIFYLILPATSLMLLKCFSLQHEIGHRGIGFKKSINESIGTFLSLLTLIPYRTWKNEHSLHHSKFSLIDHQEFGDVFLLSTKKYKKLPAFLKFLYRIYRNPLIMLFLGPIYYLLIRQRIPSIQNKKNWIYHTIFTCYLFLIILTIYNRFDISGVLSFVTIYFVYGFLGTAIFFVEHQFVDAKWEHQPSKWNRIEASIEGSSIFILPRWLEWVTSNIGYHSIHHIDPKIPHYRLREAYTRIAQNFEFNHVSFSDALHCFKLSLADSNTGRLISFREYELSLKS